MLVQVVLVDVATGEIVRCSESCNTLDEALTCGRSFLKDTVLCYNTTYRLELSFTTSSQYQQLNLF